MFTPTCSKKTLKKVGFLLKMSLTSKAPGLLAFIIYIQNWFWTFRNLYKTNYHTVKSEIRAAPQKIVIPKENRHNSAFSFGITHFWGAAFISDFTVVENNSKFENAANEWQFQNYSNICPNGVIFIVSLLSFTLDFPFG